MKIAVWKTGHEIADTVADALAEGFNGEIQCTSNMASFDRDAINVCYGILRGSSEVFRRSSRWFNVDRGYFNPGHFDGYYRISYRGTQARWHEGIPRKAWDGKLEPWRLYDKSRPILFCPPTEPVEEFFNLQDWYLRNIPVGGFIRRDKGETRPLQEDLDRCRAVITFNSSVGWQALQRGIPVLSDVNHSIIGSHYGINYLNKLTEGLQVLPDTRRELFECMSAHQFTLEEIRQGKAWPLIEHYISLSDSTIEKPSPLMSAPIQSGSALKAHFQSNT